MYRHRAPLCDCAWVDCAWADCGKRAGLGMCMCMDIAVNVEDSVHMSVWV